MDGEGDVCDPCPTDPDLDGDDVCNDDQVLVEYETPTETVLVEFGAVVRDGSGRGRLGDDLPGRTSDDPGIAMDWVQESLRRLGLEHSGTYGVGYETAHRRGRPT